MPNINIMSQHNDHIPLSYGFM